MIFLRMFAMAMLVVSTLGNTMDAQVDRAAQPALSITLQPISPTFQLGKPALVRVSLKNVSSSTVTLEVFAPHPAYHLFDFSLVANSQAVQETPLHRSVKNRQRVEDPPADLSLRSILVDIPPGIARNYEADLTHLFNVGEVGSYRLVVSMTDPASGKRIVSPELLVSVTK